MKKIELTEFENPKEICNYATDKMYCVRLGNETVNYFSSKKHTVNFLAETNRKLNEILFFTNKLYASVFLEYRRIWAYGDKYHETVRNLEINFSQINTAFEKTVKKTTYSGNYYAFRSLNHILDTLTESSIEIFNIYKARNYYSEIRDIKSLIKQIAYTRKEIENIGNSGSKPEYLELF